MLNRLLGAEVVVTSYIYSVTSLSDFLEKLSCVLFYCNVLLLLEQYYSKVTR